MGVRQIGQREGHGAMSKNGGRRGLTGTLIEGSIGLKHRNLAKRGAHKTGSPREAWLK
jgi:hypothetical protein